jgi:hypothetical protein
MKLFIIKYLSHTGTECIDVQQAPHIFEAMVLHFLTFPHSRRPVVRTMGA